MNLSTTPYLQAGGKLKVFIGSDHAAFSEKEELKKLLQENYATASTTQFEVVDVGCFSSERANYAEYASHVATHVQAGEGLGIIICGSGIGVSMVANRFAGVRAALVRSATDAKLAREHNNANVLCMGARQSSTTERQEMVKAWLEASFEGGRHVDRIHSFNSLGETSSHKFFYNRAEQWIVASVIGSIIFGTLLAVLNHTYYLDVYAKEDGYLEYGSVLGLGLVAVLMFHRAWRLRSRSWTFLAGLILLGCVAIFGFGEEISWGQRLVGRSSSEFFAQNNSQGETNLHNLVINGVKLNKLIFGTLLSIVIVLYILVVPFLFRKIDWIKKVLNSFAVPIPRTVHTVAYLILFLLATASGSFKRGEMLEFGGIWIFFCICYFPANKENFN